MVASVRHRALEERLSSHKPLCRVQREEMAFATRQDGCGKASIHTLPRDRPHEKDCIIAQQLQLSLPEIMSTEALILNELVRALHRASVLGGEDFIAQLEKSAN